MSATVFIVFQWREGDDTPEVQGVFSTIEKAEAECLSENYCVCPCVMDESRGHERQETWQDAFFPKASCDV
jgi:hypothetical protein